MNIFFLRFLFFGIILSAFYFSAAQDTAVARADINFLTSPACWGRGYTKNGIEKSAEYLNSRFKQIGLKPFAKKKYSQFYTMNVNTFPGKMEVIADGRKLKPGVHYIVNDASAGIKGAFSTVQKDSLTWLAFQENRQAPLVLRYTKKLTWGASQEQAEYTVIDLLRDSFPGQVKNLDVQIESKFIQNYKLQNICGYINGTEKKDSFIVFTAHYDHLGGMGNETFFPGANDNASGVSMLLQLAAHFKKNPSKYSVAFILFSGEEAGLAGSKYFTEHPLFPLSKIKFLLNLDLLGTGDEGITVVNATEFKPQFELLKNVNTEHQLLTLVKPRGKAANSDHYWFTEKGVPAFFIYTMGGIKAYHDVFDVSKTLPLTKFREVFTLLTEFAGRL